MVYHTCTLFVLYLGEMTCIAWAHVKNNLPRVAFSDSKGKISVWVKKKFGMISLKKVKVLVFFQTCHYNSYVILCVMHEK